MKNREYAVGVGYGFVNDPIRIADHLTDAFVVCRRVCVTFKGNDRTHFREIAKWDDGIAYLGSPALRIVSGEFTRDCPDDSAKLARRCFRPSVGHGRTLSLISFSSESNSSSSSTASSFAKSCRDFSTNWFRYERFRMASISSQVLSKSATLIITLVKRPFCVMTIGRCVRAVRAKQSLRVRRYSVNGTTSSSSRGRSIVFDMVLISFSPSGNGDIVPYPVPFDKWASCPLRSRRSATLPLAQRASRPLRSRRSATLPLGQRASCPLRLRLTGKAAILAATPKTSISSRIVNGHERFKNSSDSRFTCSCGIPLPSANSWREIST